MSAERVARSPGVKQQAWARKRKAHQQVVERGRPAFDAQAVSGRRSIFRSACSHRLVCGSAGRYGERLVHSGGLSFATETAAQCFDVRQTVADGCGRCWCR